MRLAEGAARFMTPRQAIAEMHDAAFDMMSNTERFEALTYELGPAVIWFSTHLSETRKKE